MNFPPLLVLDFETVFDSKAGFTLKKMTTEHYVRSESFKTHMLGYWVPDTMAAPAECNHDMLETNQSLRQRIRSSAVLFHHAQFDALILSHWYDLRPAFIYDTLAMARLVLPKLKSHSLGALAKYFGLPEKHVPYDLFDGVRDLPPATRAELAAGCRHDVWLTKEIFDRLLPYVPEEELFVIDATVRMFTEPMLELDRPRMEAFLRAEKIRKAKAMLAAGEAMRMPNPMILNGWSADGLTVHLRDIETELQSSAKFKLALEAIGVECPVKWSEKATEICATCHGAMVDQPSQYLGEHTCETCLGTGKTKGGWIPAIAKSDEAMKALLEHEDSRVQALASARLSVKSTLNETRAQAFLDNDSRGKVAIYLSYAAQKTLRASGGDGLNFKNMPRGGELRASIQAPKGHKIVVGDLSQIEYRLLCWTTGQTDKLDKLRQGVDLYSETAADFYGYPVSKELPKERGLGKQITLSCGYGAGADSVQATARRGTYGPPLVLTDAEALKARDLYRSTHPEVVAFWRWCEKTALPALYHGQTTSYHGGVRTRERNSADLLHIEDHKIWLPNDTAIDYTGLRWATNAEIFPDQQDDGEGPCWWETNRKGYGRTWGSHVCADIHQALARVVLVSIMVRMLRKHGVRPALEVYDELVFCVPGADVERVKAALITEMTTPPAWCADLFLACEVEVSQNYSK